MKMTKFSEAQIAFILKQADEGTPVGTPVGEVCRKAGMPLPTGIDRQPCEFTSVQEFSKQAKPEPLSLFIATAPKSTKRVSMTSRPALMQSSLIASISQLLMRIHPVNDAGLTFPEFSAL